MTRAVHESSLLEPTTLEPDDLHLEDLLRANTPEIILHNDDVNSFEHVIACLIEICGHSEIQAEQITFIVHTNGKCSIKKGPLSELEPMCALILNEGLSAEIA